MNKEENHIYYMERDGAVKIPEKYDKMNLTEITAECVRLSKIKTAHKKLVKQEKSGCKTKFGI
jgi:hypothetical protein